MDKQLTGLISAAYTPMHEGGELNLEPVPRLVERLLSSGVSGVYVCGSTGEGVSLATSERKAVTEAFVAAAAGRLPVIVQVGHNSLAEARDLAAHAEASGADMISANSPSYFKPANVDVLVDCMASIASAAPSLPFYYYHIPALTGAALDMVEFLERGARVPTLAGIKFSDLRVFDFQACLSAEDGRYDILWGCDEMLLSAMAVGARGAVGSTFNVAAPLYLKIIEAFDKGDLDSARAFQLLSIQLVRIVNRYAPLHTSLKAVMSMIGLDCGGVRLPQKPLPAGVYEKVEADLKTTGVWDWLAHA